MGSSRLTELVRGFCEINIKVDRRVYENIKKHVHVLHNLCADVILGQDWQAKHECVTINYGGDEPSIKPSGLTTGTLDVDSVWCN